VLQSVKTRKLVRRSVGQALIYAMLVPLAGLFTTPLLWLVSTALKPDAQLAAWPPVWVPNPPDWVNFVQVFTEGRFGLYLQNTLFIAVLATIGSVLTASMAAFGFCRLRFPGRDFLFGVLLATMMLPGVVTLIPTFILFRHLNWLNSYKPLIVPAYFGGGAFFIFLLRQSFMGIPHELFEQAKIDGASSWRQYWQIMLPLSKPVLSTVTIFSLMGHWNDFMGPLIYINDPERFTLSLGLSQYIGVAGGIHFQDQMAFALLMTLPLIVAFAAFQQYFIKGVVMSGIKA
jgi:ABC-type glycerol-3-phosphate transport system permease component